MNRTTFLKLAASASCIAAGFGAAAPMVVAGDSAPARVDTARAERAAERASEALQRGRQDRALRFAEEAVANAPGDPEHRELLGQAYLSSGRFASAEASFAAARELGSTSGGAVVGHALSLIALGRGGEAASLVDANASNLPASDYGLALALAGHPERGALVLTDVVRAGGSTARDRQNLALAYALAGRWLEARLIAGQDLSPAVVGDRMEQWAAMAQAGDPGMRIAGLLGTEVREDAGMPVRLALRGGAAASVALAASDDPAPLALYAPAPPTDSAALVDELLAEPQPVAVAATDTAPEPSFAPVELAAASEPGGIVYVSEPVVQQLREVVAMVAPLAAPEPAPRASRAATRVAAAAPAHATGPVRTRGWAVQLGAFDSVGVAQDGWSRASRRFSSQLAGKDGVTTSATVRGTTVYRLAATGFGSRAQASAACGAIARSGGACFVREIGAGEPVRWASRSVPTRVASR